MASVTIVKLLTQIFCLKYQVSNSGITFDLIDGVNEKTGFLSLKEYSLVKKRSPQIDELGIRYSSRDAIVLS